METPTRRPVYDPGPMLTHTASQSESDRPRSESISCTNTAVSDAWALGAELSRYETMAPFSARAVEQRAVDVSMSMILSIVIRVLLVPEKQFLEVWEYRVGHVLERREEDRAVQHFFVDQVECVVERAEGHDAESDDEAGLEKGEDDSEKTVQPSEHHELECAFQKLSDEGQGGDHGDEDECECHNLHDLLRTLDILSEPCADQSREAERKPYSGDDRYDGDDLRDEALAEALYQSWHETDQKNDIQYVHNCLKMSIFAV